MSDRPGRFGWRDSSRRRRRRRAVALERLESRELLSGSPSTIDLGESYLVDGIRVGLARATDQVIVRFDVSQGAADPGRLTASGAPLAGFQAEATANGAWWVYSRPSVAPDRPAADLLADLDGRRALAMAVPGVLDAAPAYLDTASQERVYLTRDVIVALQPGASASQVFARPDVASYRPLLGTDDQFIVTTATAAGGAILPIAEQISADARVSWAAPDVFVVMRPMILNDPLLANQWHLNNTGQNGSKPGADANVFGAWADGVTGSGVVLAVLDDGFDLDHPDLAPNVFVNAGEIPGDGIDNDNNGYVDDVNGWDFWDNDNDPRPVNASDNHGTAVAGVAAARGNNGIGVAGSAYLATILPVRIPLGVPAPASAFSQSVYYASGRNASGRGTWGGASVLNHSYGGGSPMPGVQQAFDWSATSGRSGRGALNFVATGNSGASSISFPAVYDSVIAIGASTDLDVRASYSQYGPQIDFVAPSNGGRAGITTTDRVGSAGYDPNSDYTNSFGGTSSATPLAAGIGALVLQANPALTLDEVRAVFRSTARKIGGVIYDGSGFNIQYGYGKLDATAAVRYAVSRLTVSVPGNLGENQPATSQTVGTLEFGVPTNIADYRAEIDWGDGTPAAPGALVPVGGNRFEIVSAPRSFQEGGAFTMTISIIRQGAVVLTGGADYSVATLPMHAVGVPIQTTEGVPFNGVVATFIDTDPDPMNAGDYAATIDWGDGVVSPGTIAALGGNQFQVVGYHVFAGGTHPVSVRIDGPGNATTTADTSAVVENSVLEVSPLVVQAVEGQAYTGPVATFTDADPRGNPASYYSAEIDWGDGPYASTDVNRPVPDNSLGGVASVLRINVGVFNIADLSVNLNISHGRISDLKAVLIAPDGTRVTLFDQLRQGGVNFTGTHFSDGAARSITSGTAPFTGSFRPQEALSSLRGKALSGTWELEVTDSRAGFTGTLNGWSIEATDQGRIVPAPGGGFQVAGNHFFPVGQRQVRVTVRDSDVSNVNINDNPTIVNVANAVITAIPSRIRATEGVPFSGIVGVFHDADPRSTGAGFSASIDWGDGTVTPGRVLPDGGGQFVVLGDHTYLVASAPLPGGAYDVQVTLVEHTTDTPPVYVESVTGHSPAVVASAPIVAEPLTFEVSEGILAEDVVVARFRTANTLALAPQFTATITWQLGYSSPGTVHAVAGVPGLFEIRGDALYLASGEYNVDVALFDAGGQFVPITSTARVVDAPLITTPVPISAIERTPMGSVVVARFVDTNPFGTGTGFRASIDWGNGTVSPGTVVSDGAGGLEVRGGTTYADPGRFTVIVTIIGGGGSETLVETEATVADLILPLTGGLDGGSDTGVSATDWVTRNRVPIFRGTAEARSVVILYATVDGGNRRAVGTARADANGAWAIRSASLADGRYTMQALATDTQGRPSSLLTTLSGPSGARLVIDGTSPRVASATMEASSRTFRLQFTDALSGVPSSVFLNPALYGLGIAGQPNSLGRPTSLALDPRDPNAVLLRFNTSRVRGGNVVLSMNSAGVTDVAGNVLYVDRFLSFPGTNPGPGQPFLAQFNLGGRGTVQAVPYVPPAQVTAANNYFQFLRQRALPRYLRR